MINKIKRKLLCRRFAKGIQKYKYACLKLQLSAQETERQFIIFSWALKEELK